MVFGYVVAGMVRSFDLMSRCLRYIVDASFATHAAYDIIQVSRLTEVCSSRACVSYCQLHECFKASDVGTPSRRLHSTNAKSSWNAEPRFRRMGMAEAGRAMCMHAPIAGKGLVSETPNPR